MIKKEARPYQAKGKELISDCFQRGIFYPILCVPTGGGKTVMFSDMTRDCINEGWPVLIMCHREELIESAHEELKENGLYPTLIVPGYRDQYSNLYLASVDTLRNRKLPDVKVVIIDECHIRAFDEIALEYKRRGVIVIGCTATPIRSGKAELEAFPDYQGQLWDIYEEIVTPTTITELLQNDYLVPAISYGPEVDLGSIKTTQTDFGTDYQTAALYEAFNKPKLYAGCVDNYLKLAPGTKALCFCINVEHSIKQAEEFNRRGIKAEHVDGKSKDRKKKFNRFQYGDTQVLCNCGVATTGTNIPQIESIILNRKTMSHALFKQMCGRGGRKCDQIGKTHFILIDQGGNIWEHGFWEDEKEYSLEPERISKTIGPAPIKECENCKALLPISAQICKYCEAAQAKKEKSDDAMPTAEFSLLEREHIPKELKKEVYKMTIAELEQYRVLKEYKLGWLVRQLWTRGDETIAEYARLKGYADAWVWRQIKDAEEARINAKAELWDFIKDNSHLDEEVIKSHAIKKLKVTHKESEINILIPKILENVGLYKKDPAAFL